MTFYLHPYPFGFRFETTSPVSATVQDKLYRSVARRWVENRDHVADACGEDFVLEAYNAGVDDCMIKPVSPSLFQAKIKVWLRRSGSVTSAILNPLKVGTLQLFPSERLALLKNVVYRLRRKIEVDPASPLIIQTVTGAGYRLAAE